MTGREEWYLFKSLEEELDKLDLKLSASRYDNALSVVAKNNEAFPIYADNVEFARGSAEDIMAWVRGVQWARNYDRMLFGKHHEEKRKRLEQNCRNEILVKILKGEDKKQ